MTRKNSLGTVLALAAAVFPTPLPVNTNSGPVMVQARTHNQQPTPTRAAPAVAREILNHAVFDYGSGFPPGTSGPNQIPRFRGYRKGRPRGRMSYRSHRR